VEVIVYPWATSARKKINPVSRTYGIRLEIHLQFPCIGNTRYCRSLPPPAVITVRMGMAVNGSLKPGLSGAPVVAGESRIKRNLDATLVMVAPVIVICLAIWKFFLMSDFLASLAATAQQSTAFGSSIGLFEVVKPSSSSASFRRTIFWVSLSATR